MKLSWETSLDATQHSIIDRATQVASRLDSSVFLVGGPARDLLLGRPVFDLDFSVAGDAAPFAHALGKELDARVVENPQFLTWRLEFHGTRPVDVVTCRTETYRAPGALPDVRPSQLDDDLARRDFSINAIALELRSRELIDRHGGVEDLRSRSVRVLHDRSFVDDPTRILRALRLAARLQFSIEQRTLALLRSAIADGALQTVSSQRLWREFMLAIEEEAPADAVIALVEENVLAPLLGEVVATDALRESVRRVERTAVMAGSSLAESFVGVLLAEALKIRLTADTPFRSNRIEQLLLLPGALPRLNARLRSTRSATRKLLLLAHSSPELRSVAASRSDQVADALRLWNVYDRARVDSTFSHRVAKLVGRRTGHYVRLARVLQVLRGCEPIEAERLAEAAILRYLQRRKTHS